MTTRKQRRKTREYMQRNETINQLLLLAILTIIIISTIATPYLIASTQ